MRSAKTQISLRISAVWSESSQGILRVAKERKRIQTLIRLRRYLPVPVYLC